MICGNERIRYVYIVEHNKIDEELTAGCNCAEKINNDCTNPGKLEKNLKNKTVRRSKWILRIDRLKKKESTLKKTGVSL